MTVSRWAEANGFNPRYCQAVMSGKRGAWNVGTAKKILLALKNQGLLSSDEYVERINTCEVAK